MEEEGEIIIGQVWRLEKRGEMASGLGMGVAKKGDLEARAIPSLFPSSSSFSML